MTHNWRVDDYFWAPHIPRSGHDDKPWPYGAIPLIAKVTDTFDVYVHAAVVVGGGHDATRDHFWFGHAVMHPISNDVMLKAIAVHALTGNIPDILLEEITNAL